MTIPKTSRLCNTNPVSRDDANSTIRELNGRIDPAYALIASNTADIATKISSTLASAEILVGNASNVATAVPLTGDVSITNAGATTVATVGTSTAANVHAAELLANAATSANTSSAIVRRNGGGGFTAGTITASLTGTASGNLPLALMTNWVAYTPTGTWVTNVTYAGLWRRVGDTLECQVSITLTGAPDASTLTNITIPSGLTVDSTKSLNSSSLKGSVGTGIMSCAGVQGYFLNITNRGTQSTVQPFAHTITGYNGATSTANTGVGNVPINNIVPGTFASGDFIQMMFKLPIVAWAF